MTVSIEDILRLVSLQLGIQDIGERDHFMEALNAESMDILNIIATIEEKYYVEIPEAKIRDLLTPRDLYDYLRSHI